MNLLDAEINQEYTIQSITGIYRQKLSELGFNPGCKIKIVNKQISSMMVVNCRESHIALRKDEAKCIFIN